MEYLKSICFRSFLVMMLSLSSPNWQKTCQHNY